MAFPLPSATLGEIMQARRAVLASGGRLPVGTSLPPSGPKPSTVPSPSGFGSELCITPLQSTGIDAIDACGRGCALPALPQMGWTEVYGGRRVGKSTLAMNAVVQCVLPRSLGGCEQLALVVDCDQSWNIGKLARSIVAEAMARECVILLRDGIPLAELDAHQIGASARSARNCTSPAANLLVRASARAHASDIPATATALGEPARLDATPTQHVTMRANDESDDTDDDVELSHPGNAAGGNDSDSDSDSVTRSTMRHRRRKKHARIEDRDQDRVTMPKRHVPLPLGLSVVLGAGKLGSILRGTRAGIDEGGKKQSFGPISS